MRPSIRSLWSWVQKHINREILACRDSGIEALGDGIDVRGVMSGYLDQESIVINYHSFEKYFWNFLSLLEGFQRSVCIWERLEINKTMDLSWSSHLKCWQKWSPPHLWENMLRHRPRRQSPQTDRKTILILQFETPFIFSKKVYPEGRTAAPRVSKEYLPTT